jgi:hypothetical protein
MIFQKGGIGIVKSDFKNHLNFVSEWNGWIGISLLFELDKVIYKFIIFISDNIFPRSREINI